MHIPVLLKEVLEYLQPQSGDNFIDCTLGGGGHTKAILERVGLKGQVLAIDADKEAIKRFKREIKAQELKNAGDLILVNDNFSNLEKIVKKYNFSPVQGILADLGFSSYQVEDEKRGFSFLRPGPLDMRYNRKQSLTAEKIVNTYSQEDLKAIFEKYGEEERAEEIARAIGKTRKGKPFKDTLELADLIAQIKPHRGRIHPATKVFQALRIEVNQELKRVEEFLPQAIRILSSGGRLAVITFHSLEDRIVKHFFKKHAVNIHACRVRGAEDTSSASPDSLKVKLINKKVIIPSWQERRRNPRSRSAKLRVVEKV